MQKVKSLVAQAIVFILIACISSCSFDSENIPDVSHIPMDIEVKRLEKEVEPLASREEIASFLASNTELKNTYFQNVRFPNDSILINQIGLFLNLEFNDTLFNDVEKAFGSFEHEEEEIEDAFRRIKYHFPSFNPPQIATMVSGFGSFGFGQDIFVDDNLIVIGLDYFAGKKATYRPKDIPAYIQRRYEPEYIVPTLTQFISSEFNAYTPEDRTMLGEMVFYGKSLYFMEKILPFVPDTVLIGYTGQELADCYNNEAVIWGHFLQNNLLYETSHFQKAKYIGESPRVQTIDYECPGRIGRWLGWQIIRSLAETENLTLPEIMQLKSAEQILKRSKYKPQE